MNPNSQKRNLKLDIYIFCWLYAFFKVHKLVLETSREWILPFDKIKTTKSQNIAYFLIWFLNWCTNYDANLKRTNFKLVLHITTRLKWLSVLYCCKNDSKGGDYDLMCFLCFLKSFIPAARAVKVHIFWEGSKFLRNFHQLFAWQYIGQIIGGDFAKFCAFSEYINFTVKRQLLLLFMNDLWISNSDILWKLKHIWFQRSI